MNLQRNLKIITLAAHRTAARAEAAHPAGPPDRAQRVVVDFSSPNIAKPFHFGHLKSTILGNFLANLNQYYGNHVTKLNYIGDWGTQYGLLSMGLDHEESLLAGDAPMAASTKPQLERLLEIYKAANARGAEDENFYRQARARFQAMDSGQDPEQLEKWRQVRDISLNELRSSYQQLGIQFDAFEYESEHARGAQEIIAELRRLGHLIETPDGVLVTEVIKNNKPIRVPVLKSDGSSLYITRDIVAALRRKEQYQFDKLYYVVGADQEKHFYCLREILKLMGRAWAGDLIHVKMGKVKGMSSRSGEAVLLSKIIQEATRIYQQSTRDVPTSKVSSELDVERVGQQLALSGLYVFDLRNKRTRNYDFEWAKVMIPGGRSGIHLQTTHARLCSLRDKAFEQMGFKPYESMDEINYDSVYCIEGVHLIHVLNGLARKLDESYQTLDPSPLVNHALLLCKAANRARQSDWLHVLHECDDHKAISRLSLFEAARSQLALIIKMIGLQPLERV